MIIAAFVTGFITGAVTLMVIACALAGKDD